MLNGKTVPKPWPATAMKDRSTMVTFVNCLGCSERFPRYFALNHNAMAVKQKLSYVGGWATSAVVEGAA